MMEITGIAACMAQPNMASFEREKLLENWLYHLTHASLRIAGHFVFIFERMLAGGNRPDCPLYGQIWPTDAAGEPVAENGFTDQDVEWMKGPRNTGAPGGVLDRLLDYSGAAFQREMFGGVVIYSESEELAGPWMQRGYPVLL